MPLLVESGRGAYRGKSSIVKLIKMNSTLPVKCMLLLMYFVGFKGSLYALWILVSHFYLDSNTDSFLFPG